MKKIFETGMLLFATMGFWGMIYPDLCFTEDVCEVYIIADDTLCADANVESLDADVKGADASVEISDADVKSVDANIRKADAETRYATTSASGKTSKEETVNTNHRSEILPMDIFTRLCMADSEQIQFKFKFMEVFLTGKQGKSECRQ